MIEFAHPMGNGKCRFLVQKLRGQGIGFTGVRKCKPGLNGKRGYFTMSFDAFSDRVQITIGSRHVFKGEKKFLGLSDKFLALTTLRHKDMSGWVFDLNKVKTCPLNVLQNL